jgi:hypothetical protein
MVSGCAKQNHELMKNKLTLKDIRKKWWWKRKEILRAVKTEVDWPAVEEAARNYELMRRSPKGKQFTQAYWQLSREGKTIVHTLWVNYGQGTYRNVTNSSQFTEIGWTPVYENQRRQWNLRQADNLLIKEFIREIKALRTIQKIHPQHPLKGEHFRGASWTLIELLDRKQNGIGKFNESQRHTISEAKRRAKKYFSQYKNALAKQEKIPNPFAFLLELPNDVATLQP